MNEDDVRRHVYSLKRELHLDVDEKEILNDLKILSKDLNTLRETKRQIYSLDTANKKLIKENALAVIQRNNDIDQTKTLFLSTFIVAIAFLALGVVSTIIGLLLLLPIIFVAIHFVLRDYKKKNHIYQYKLIKYIEDLDTN